MENVPSFSDSRRSLRATSTFSTNGGGARSAKTNCANESVFIWIGATTGSRSTNCWSWRVNTRRRSTASTACPAKIYGKLARDRHAADKIAEIRQKHPGAVILILFGESHLAPGHLPHTLEEKLPAERTLTVLQNVDALYWRAA